MSGVFSQLLSLSVSLSLSLTIPLCFHAKMIPFAALYFPVSLSLSVLPGWSLLTLSQSLPPLPPSGPSLVGQLKKDWASPNSIALSWQAPEQTPLPVLDYEVKYYEKVHRDLPGCRERGLSDQSVGMFKLQCVSFCLAFLLLLCPLLPLLFFLLLLLLSPALLPPPLLLPRSTSSSAIRPPVPDRKSTRLNSSHL